MRTSILLGLALIYPAACWAADIPFDVKPGLWNMSTTVQVSGMPPIPNLDQLSPEQRARIESAMKGMSGHTMTTKSCVTKDSIEKAIAKANNNGKSSCSTKIVSSSASEIKIHVGCVPESGAGVKTDGDITIDRLDSEHIKGSGAMKSSTANGRTMDTKWSMTGAFASSDCGDVKP